MYKKDNPDIYRPPPHPGHWIELGGGIVIRQDDILRDARKNKWSQTSGTIMKIPKKIRQFLENFEKF